MTKMTLVLMLSPIHASLPNDLLVLRAMVVQYMEWVFDLRAKYNTRKLMTKYSGFIDLCRANLSIHEFPCVCCPEDYQRHTDSGCRSNDDCSLDEACFSDHCMNPCVMTEACGLDADCRAVNHTPRCSCPPGYTGNPFIRCSPIQPGNSEFPWILEG